MLRWAVYRLGAEQGRWAQLSEEDVRGFMDFLFPKSKQLAHYNLMRNVVLSSDSIKSLPQSSYNLFKFPEQIEEALLEYQKKHLNEDFSDKHETPMEVLNRLATVVSDSDLFSSSVGSLDDIGLENMIAILAYRYRSSFVNNNDANPYFE